jgi:hypothetical protein
MTTGQAGLFDDRTGSDLNTEFDRWMRAEHYSRQVIAYSREVAECRNEEHIT